MTQVRVELWSSIEPLFSFEKSRFHPYFSTLYFCFSTFKMLYSFFIMNKIKEKIIILDQHKKLRNILST